MAVSYEFRKEIAACLSPMRPRIAWRNSHLKGVMTVNIARIRRKQGAGWNDTRQDPPVHRRPMNDPARLPAACAFILRDPACEAVQDYRAFPATTALPDRLCGNASPVTYPTAPGGEYW
jgi:hypothetical protein